MRALKLGIAAAVLTVAPVAAATPTLAAAPGPATPQASKPCPVGALCVYHDRNYQGAMVPIVKCGANNRLAIGWLNVGSWINNQTHGQVGVFRDIEGHVWSRTGPAPSSNPNQNWRPIWSAQAC
ncbi:MAG TPA: peptidase inhibitor family I36 protein [Mycobacteriales bacterium]|nr:peptidase inhibitor family I36 protein [Mycobacteriales bacterium]